MATLNIVCAYSPGRDLPADHGVSSDRSNRCAA
jgi:hypothetical protein